MWNRVIDKPEKLWQKNMENRKLLTKKDKCNYAAEAGGNFPAQCSLLYLKDHEPALTMTRGTSDLSTLACQHLFITPVSFQVSMGCLPYVLGLNI